MKVCTCHLPPSMRPHRHLLQALASPYQGAKTNVFLPAVKISRFAAHHYQCVLFVVCATLLSVRHFVLLFVTFTSVFRVSHFPVLKLPTDSAPCLTTCPVVWPRYPFPSPFLFKACATTLVRCSHANYCERQLCVSLASFSV